MDTIYIFYQLAKKNSRTITMDNAKCVQQRFRTASLILVQMWIWAEPRFAPNVQIMNFWLLIKRVADQLATYKNTKTLLKPQNFIVKIAKLQFLIAILNLVLILQLDKLKNASNVTIPNFYQLIKRVANLIVNLEV